MPTKIEQLIEKRQIRNKNPYEETNIPEFINDLQSLQPTEDREVEIKINKHSNIVNINCSLCKHSTFWNETVLKSYKYCPWCWAKIKRVD